MKHFITIAVILFATALPLAAQDDPNKSVDPTTDYTAMDAEKFEEPILDISGGVSLIYDIAPGDLTGKEAKGLVQRMIPILRRRIDPANMANIKMIPRGDTRIEIQLPRTAQANPNAMTAEQFKRLVLKIVSTHPDIRALNKPVVQANSIDLQFEKLAKEYYKETSGRQNTSLYAIIGIFAGFLAYFIFTDRKLYQEALKRAEAAADRTEKLEDKTQAILDRLHKEADKNTKDMRRDVKEKLKAIEDQGKAQISALTKEAKTQHRKSELWNEAEKAYKAGDYKKTCINLEELESKHQVLDSPQLYNNWGLALGRIAIQEENKTVKNQLFNTAIDKFKKALEIDINYNQAYTGYGAAVSQLADLEDDKVEKSRLLVEAMGLICKTISTTPNNHVALDNLGYTKLELSKLTTDNAQQQKYLQEALSTFMKCQPIEPGYTAYNIACYHALCGNPKECRRWLLSSDRHGFLPKKEHAMNDTDLISVRDEEWFQKLNWK